MYVGADAQEPVLALPAPPTRPPLKLGPSIQVPCCPPSSRPIHHLNHASQQSKSHTRNLKHGPCRVWGAAHGQLPAARPPLPAGAVCSNQTFYCYPALCSRPQGMTSARRPLSQWGSSLGGGGGSASQHRPEACWHCPSSDMPCASSVPADVQSCHPAWGYPPNRC